MYCKKPFIECEIYADGQVYTCCPFYLKDDYYIGNIFKVNSFDEIWYSEKAIELRKRILNSDYSLCNSEVCAKEYFSPKLDCTEKPPYPEFVKFSFDSTCNLKCIFCRDDYRKFERKQEFLGIIDSILAPVIYRAKKLNICTVGEVTASEYSSMLLDKVICNAPSDLKLEFTTNGLLFDENFVNKHNIIDRIDNIVVSLHAITEDTYNKIVQNSNFKQVIKNIEYISSLKRSGKINSFSIAFVCMSINYKEIIDFINFANDMSANALIWEYRKRQTKMDDEYEKYAVWDKLHPEYNDFVKIIQKVKDNENNFEVRLPDFFYDLKPVSPIEKIALKTKKFISSNIKS